MTHLEVMPLSAIAVFFAYASQGWTSAIAFVLIMGAYHLVEWYSDRKELKASR